MARGGFVIRTVTFLDDGMSIEYVEPARDIKSNGVQCNHIVYIPLNHDYEPGFDGVRDGLLDLLDDVLDDVGRLGPPEAPAGDDEDDPDDDDEEQDGRDDQDDPSQREPGAG